ncbi:MAG: NAD+ synthase [Candidatus Omnitrophica bacterium]|jgi:NAD+ synthase|nr:NAD+ synthase [Candidatus Omnitrophota bacterium]
MKGFDINSKVVRKKLINFVRSICAAKGFSKVILGLSGGLDSSVVAYLSVQALGKDNVLGVSMPYGTLFNQSTQDAKRLAAGLGIKVVTIDIKPMLDAYFRTDRAADNIRRGNKMARERMSILFDLSRVYDSLVVGTSNRTEILVGYGTIYGDCAYAFNPIACLYKSQLKYFASYLGIPSFILKKAPSADLWPGQTDEGEMGYAYKDIDRLLFCMIDKKMDKNQLILEGFDTKFINYIKNRVRNNKFKSQLPVMAKL